MLNVNLLAYSCGCANSTSYCHLSLILVSRIDSDTTRVVYRVCGSLPMTSKKSSNLLARRHYDLFPYSPKSNFPPTIIPNSTSLLPMTIPRNRFSPYSRRRNDPNLNHDLNAPPIPSISKPRTVQSHPSRKSHPGSTFYYSSLDGMNSWRSFEILSCSYYSR